MNEPVNPQFERLERMHQLILDAAGEGVYGLDANGNTTFVNQAAERILGWHMEDVIGKPLHDIHHHSHADGSPYPREECPIYLAIRDGQVHQVDDEVFWRADGTSVPVEYTSTPIIEHDGICGAVVVFRDITARKEMERQRDADYQQIKCLKDLLEQERDYLRDIERLIQQTIPVDENHDWHLGGLAEQHARGGRSGASHAKKNTRGSRGSRGSQQRRRRPRRRRRAA